MKTPSRVTPVEIKKENYLDTFQELFPYIIISEEDLSKAYDHIANRNPDLTQNPTVFLDLMQDYILSQDLPEEVIP